jgi:ribose/xylose/arabinose/galactoside ABC-type transport system permease subunit
MLTLLQRYQALAGLVILSVVAFVVCSRDNPDGLFGSVFFSPANLENVLNQLAVPGILAIGATFVIISGGIDLSAGSALGLLNCVAAKWLVHGESVWVTSAYVLTLGVLIGALQGTIISVTRLQPFIVTLAGMVSLRGIAYVYTKSAMVSGIGDQMEILRDTAWGLPTAGWLLIAITLIGAVILKYTVFGRQIYAIGGNATASLYAGVPVHRVRIGTYAFNGLCVGLAAIVLTARTKNGMPSAGAGYELDAITAAVVGGTALIGGYGSALGSFAGALFIVCLNVLLILEGVLDFVGQGWKGVIILVAVYLQNLGRKV